jgi:uncharacterized protein YecT (DUF1311 family)
MTTSLRSVLAAALLLLPAAAPAQSQRALDDDACAQAKAADAELNRVYKELVAGMANDAPLVDRLKVAQRAWVAFRDAQLTLLYPPDDTTQGSVGPMCRCRASEELTRDRVDQLKRMLTGEEGDVCSWERP